MRPVPCPWPEHCQCTHTEGCVAGWIDGEVGGKDVARPCQMCRPDLYREINHRQHVLGQSSAWMRTMPRPIASGWLRDDA